MQAYKTQKQHAKKRGIAFLLTFEEWMKIWTESGKFDERGTHGRGYVMCRKGDIGPYAVGNVYIDTHVHNIATQVRKRRVLPDGITTPTGVLYKSQKFCAIRKVGKKLVYIAYFSDPAQAEAAYHASFTISDDKLVAGDRSFLNRKK